VKCQAAELCLDTLGAGKYCDQLIAAVLADKITCIGYLVGTFDDDAQCLQRIVATNKLKSARIHLLNGPGLRNRALGAYEPHRRHTVATFSAAVERGDKDVTTAIAERAKKIESITKGKLRCLLSGVLEHDLSTKAAAKVVEILRANAPSCRVVNNPVSLRAAVLPNTIHELHGEKPSLKAPCVVSLDGIRAVAVDMPAYLKRYQHCEQIFVWDQELNCRVEGAFIDPRLRKACPTKQQFDSLLSYLDPANLKRTPAPQKIRGCSKVLKTQDGYRTGFVWKVGDHPRPGKQTVTIFPSSERWDRVRFVANGKIVDEPRFCGIANENRQHWCSNKLARQLPEGVVVQASKGRQITCRVLTNLKSGRVD